MVHRSILCVGLIGLMVTGAIAPLTFSAAGSFIPAIYAGQSIPKTSVSTEDPPDDVRAVPVMWREPVDLENRDLFYGIGGEKGKPDPADKFRFLAKVTSGHAEKIEVEDTRDRRWTVKFGEEPRPETVATRIVWAVGYHTDQDYFVEQAEIEGRGIVRNVRFERDNDGFKKVGRWDWSNNPFVGTRELDGLKVLMALLNNFDLKTDNNKIVRPGKKKSSDPVYHIYYVNDLGATLGSTGRWFGNIPLFGEAPAGTKGSPKDFAEQEFIDRVHNGTVSFRMKRTRAQREISGTKVENARWMGNLLARLSDKQIADAFRAGHFSDETIQIYVRALRKRISQLQALK
jgi:hypothetical protein